MYRLLLGSTVAMFAAAISENQAAASEEAQCCGGGERVARARRGKRVRVVKKKIKTTMRRKARIDTRKLKAGMNLVDRNPHGFRLYVKVTPGKLLEYVMKDRKGRLIRTTMKSVRTKDKKTVCWSCGVDESGGTHCWQVPCPKIIGPWIPASKLKLR